MAALTAAAYKCPAGLCAQRSPRSRSDSVNPHFMRPTTIKNNRHRRLLKRLLLPLWLRCLTTIFLPIYAWSSLPNYCLAAVEIQLDKAGSTPAPAVAGSPNKSPAKPKTHLVPPPLPKNLVAKDQVEPQTHKPEVKFSKAPTDQELFDCALLAEPL